MGPEGTVFWGFAFFVCIAILAVVYALTLRRRIRDIKNLHKNELAEAALLLERERELVVKKAAQLEDITLQLEKEEELVTEKEAQLKGATFLFEKAEELIAEKEAQLQLRTAQAFSNFVSGMPNLLGSQARIADIFDRLERGIVKKVTVVYVDLDKFKPINGEYGHDNGDKVIRIAGKILQNSVRSSDIVIHFSGDEFGIICADTEKTVIEAILKRANTALAEYNFTFAKEGRVNTSYSFGIAESNKYLRTFENLKRIADLKCMRIKEINGDSR